MSYRVVIEVSVPGSDAWEAILNNAENLTKAMGVDQPEIQLVCHGKGIGLVKRDSPFSDRVRQISTNYVRFVACQNTMRRLKLDKSDLLPGIGTVDSGVADVVRKQAAGWQYLKGGF